MEDVKNDSDYSDFDSDTGVGKQSNGREPRVTSFFIQILDRYRKCNHTEGGSTWKNIEMKPIAHTKIILRWL